MESEKVKEIKKVLKGLVDDASNWLQNAMIGGVNLADILTLINELESENERIKNMGLNEDITVREWLQENQKLKDRIAELEKEKKENNSYAKGYADGIKNTYEVVIPDKLKQFAEMLKEKSAYSFIWGKKFIVAKDIDETLKECLCDKHQ